MRQYILDIFPADFKHKTAYWRAFLLGIVMTLLAVTQLFRFEQFPDIITALRPPGGMPTAWFLAVLLPMLEIASIPYLFSMRVPAKLRLVSMWCGVAVGVLWLAITLYTTSTLGYSVESGIFGATLVTNSGWWSVVFALLLAWSIYLTIRELPKRRES